MFPQKCPFPFGDRHPHITHCSSGQAHSSSQTASRPVQPFLYGSQMLCCTNAFSMGKTPKITHSSGNLFTLLEKDRSMVTAIYFLKLSPIKITSFPMSMHQSQWYICFSANIAITIVTTATMTWVLIILPIIVKFLFLFYVCLWVISRYLVKIMPLIIENWILADFAVKQ